MNPLQYPDILGQVGVERDELREMMERRHAHQRQPELFTGLHLARRLLPAPGTIIAEVGYLPPVTQC